MAKTEPLNKVGSPTQREAQTVKLEMENKMAKIKKDNFCLSIVLYHICEREPIHKRGCGGPI